MGNQCNSIPNLSIKKVKESLKLWQIPQPEAVIIQNFAKVWSQKKLQSNKWKTLEAKDIKSHLNPLSQYRIITVSLYRYDELDTKGKIQFSSKNKKKDQDYIQINLNGKVQKIGFQICSVDYAISVKNDQLTTISGFTPTPVTLIENNYKSTPVINNVNIQSFTLIDLEKMVVQQKI